MKFKWERIRDHEGQMIPSKWLGYAYYEFDRGVCIYYIVPVNLIVAAFRWLDVRVRYMIPRSMQSLEARMYNVTKDDSYRRGYYEGYKRGKEEKHKMKKRYWLGWHKTKTAKHHCIQGARCKLLEPGLRKSMMDVFSENLLNNAFREPDK